MLFITCVVFLIWTKFLLLESAVYVDIATKRKVKDNGLQGSGNVTILFVGDGTVVQGGNTHGFIDILQAETVDAPLTIECVGNLKFDVDKFNAELAGHYVKMYQPDVIVLMLFDDIIETLVEKLILDANSNNYSYDELRTLLRPLIGQVELAISKIRTFDPSIEIVISTPLVLYKHDHIAELICECFGASLKKISFDYNVGFVDLRFPLMKLMEHHTNYDRIRHNDASVPKTRKGLALPTTVRPPSVGGRYALSEGGHSVIAHTLVTYFGLEAYERDHVQPISRLRSDGNAGISADSIGGSQTIRERVISGRLRDHLSSTGISVKHLDAWYKDSVVNVLANHKQRTTAIARMKEDYQRKIDEEIKLSTISSEGHRNYPGGDEDKADLGSGLTSSQRKRAKKRAKSKPKMRENKKILEGHDDL